ncbi:antibiotic biosynthesis monooxygenase [Yoonia sp.]|uniref:antibiotic biosynthesis monooxygenase family protein n=1 Tax=Yoonia sp. TaxID=2212373 RepID=UPI0025E32A6A|nr:antibiotic biosynthesis monooxygenase [Yoonia sp.]
MHALFFEVRPHPGHLEHYFEHVALLRPVLARHTGLAFLDRYAALDDDGLLLSHQLWESEEDIIAWRADATHRKSQSAGRRVHFADYRIRVGERILHWQHNAPRSIDPALPASDTAHVVALYGTQPPAIPAFAGFKSMNHDKQFVALASVRGSVAALKLLKAQISTPGLEQAAIYKIRRDYGQFDRAQAPL